MSIIYVAALVFFMVVNLIIYHKFVQVIYFNFGRELFKELVNSFVIAFIEVALLIAIGPYVLIAIAVLIVIIIIVGIVKASKNTPVDESNSYERAKNSDQIITEISQTQKPDYKSASSSISKLEPTLSEKQPIEDVLIRVILKYIASPADKA